MKFSELPSAERERLLGKLARLKALSECKTGNVNETATAAAAMTRLMLEYQIEMAHLDTGEPEAVTPTDITDGDRGKAYPNWQCHLLNGLAEANGCLGYQACEQEQTLWMTRRSYRLCLIGQNEDVERVKLQFFFCVNEIERLCSRWSPQARTAQRNDFRLGAAVAICTQVREEWQRVRREEAERWQETAGGSAALATLDRRADEVRDAAAKLGVRTSQRRASRGVSPSAYHAGVAAGQSVRVPGGGAALDQPAGSGGGQATLW